MDLEDCDRQRSWAVRLFEFQPPALIMENADVIITVGLHVH